MSHVDELRQITRVARMYYLDEMKQTEIARRLHLSQATVSRLLRRSQAEGIVQIRIEPPRGTFLDLEERLQARYGLAEVVVADCHGTSEAQILKRVGEAAAHYLETSLRGDEILGMSSWSEAILNIVDSLPQMKNQIASVVVQMLGGMGNPGAQAYATNLAVRMAKLTLAEPKLLSVQGVAASAQARDALMSDPFVQHTLSFFPKVTTALVGIGCVEPSKFLADSGNIFTRTELEDLRQTGAVGDICLHFFREDGSAVDAPLEQRVIGVTLDQLRAVERVIGVASGARKVTAIAGAMRSGLLDVLITDHVTALAIDALDDD